MAEPPGLHLSWNTLCSARLRVSVCACSKLVPKFEYTIFTTTLVCPFPSSNHTYTIHSVSPYCGITCKASSSDAQQLSAPRNKPSRPSSQSPPVFAHRNSFWQHQPHEGAFKRNKIHLMKSTMESGWFSFQTSFSFFSLPCYLKQLTQ